MEYWHSTICTILYENRIFVVTTFTNIVIFIPATYACVCKGLLQMALAFMMLGRSLALFTMCIGFVCKFVHISFTFEHTILTVEPGL